MAELFENFEVNKSPRWRKLLRLTGVSFVLHVVCFAAIIYVPVLRDAFHLTDRFSDAGVVDDPNYDDSLDIRDARMIAVGEKFQYPPGYFSDQYAGAQVIEEPTPLPTPIPTPIPTPTPTPTPSPSPTPSPEPSAFPSPGASGDSTVAADQSATEQKTEKDLDKVAEQNKVRRPRTINKRPFVDLLVKYKELKDKGELNLDGPVEMTIEADRNADGTLSNVVVVRKSGDPKLIEATYDFVRALSASGVLDFLEGTDHLILNLKLDNAEIAVSAATEVGSDAEARAKANGYNVLLSAAAFARSGRDEGTIMKNTKVTASGKQITVNFNLPRAAISEMLKKQIPAT